MHQMQYKNWCVTLEQEDLRGIVWDYFTPCFLGLQHLEIIMTKFSSAIYFTGTNMNTDRVLNITLNGKGQMYAMAQRREQYVNYLQQHEHDSKMSASD